MIAVNKKNSTGIDKTASNTVCGVINKNNNSNTTIVAKMVIMLRNIELSIQ